MNKRQIKEFRIKEIILNHINNHIKQYVLVTMLFVIGIMIGILLIKNSSNEIKGEISTYINTFTTKLKVGNSIDKNTLLINSIISNLKTTAIMWFMGSTVIGIPVVFGIIIFKGICIGYTISALIGVLGNKIGFILAFLSIFLQNIIYIPAILAIGVSGLDLYKVITKNRHRENVKMEILRHTVFTGIIFIAILVSCFIESYVSSTLIEWYVKLIG